MADVYPPFNEPYTKQAMRRTAPSGQSRHAPVNIQNGSFERYPSAPQASRLQQLQANFQYRMMKEKEAKMVKMYERQQEKALKRVTTQQDNQKGIVRDFFRERRMIEQNTAQSEIPSRDQHFNRIKSQVQQQREANLRENLAKMQFKENSSKRPPAGFDRAKPLAPLKHRSTVHNMNISDHKFTEREKEPISNATQDKKPLRKTNSFKRLSKRYSQHSAEGSSDEDKESNASQWQQHNRKPKSYPQNWDQNPFDKKPVFVGNRKKIVDEIKEDRPTRKTEKLSDFQKWPMEQDLEREQRLSKIRKQTISNENNFDYHDNHYDDNTHWKKHEFKPKEVKKGRKKDLNDSKRKKHIDLIKQKERELQELIAKEEGELRLIKESYLSDDYDSPRQVSMNHQVTKKPSKKADSVPVKTKKPEKIRWQSINENQDFYQQDYKENNEINHVSYDIDGAVEDQFESLDLKACGQCGRRFAVDRLAKHNSVCRKSSNKKRKTFDMTKQRTAGTVMAQYVKNGRHLNAEPISKKSNWKRKHEDFVRTVRDARMVQAHIAKGGKASDLPPPPPSDNSDYQQCPYCKRMFNPSTAERHIPKCKDIKSRPKPLTRKR